MAENTKNITGTARYKTSIDRGLRAKLQPRITLGIAMTLLSFATVARHVHPADFNLIRALGTAQQKATVVKDRAVGCYENIRFAYQLERRLAHLENQDDSERPSKIALPEWPVRSLPSGSELPRETLRCSDSPSGS